MENTMNAITPAQLEAQKEAMEFQKMAAKKEITIRRANVLMSALAVGGDVVKPLFTDETREELEAKLAGLLSDV